VSHDDDQFTSLLSGSARPRSARVDAAVAGLVSVASLVLLVWGLGGFVVWTVTR
jgi:hypothetical protein